MGRRPRFTQEDLQDAALVVLDEKGVSGLTVRAVASVLGTGPMTLYNYMDSRADLDALVVDGTLRHVVLPDTAGTDWREDVRDISLSVWSAVRRHPNAIPLILARRSRSTTFLDIAESLLDALARSGRSGQDLLVAFRAVTTMATAFAQTEIAGSVSTDRGATTPDAVIERFSTLSAQRYRRLIDLAGASVTSDPETEFLRSMAALLAGLEPAEAQ